VLNMNLIDVMPPGLYEVVLTEADGNAPRADLVEGKYIAKLVPRTLDDIRALGHNDTADQRRFETVARISDINQGLYRTFVQPIVKSVRTQASAELQREMHPNRVAFRAFSDQNPLMAPVALAAEKIKSDRHPVEQNNLFLALEEMASAWIITNLEIFAKTREAITEATFLNVYGSPLLQAAVGLKAEHVDAERFLRHNFPSVKTRAELEADMARGGFLEGAFRSLLYVLRGKGADERQFNALEVLRNCAPENERVSLPQVKEIMRQQAALLRLDEGEAVAAISKILPDDPGRRARALAAIYGVISADGEPDPDENKKFRDISRLFEGPESKKQVRPNSSTKQGA
jgi:hypothetical protein